MNLEMPKSFQLVILIATVLGLLFWPENAYFLAQSRSSGELHTTLVLDYVGPMDASKSSMHVRVYKLEKFSTGVSDTKSVFQNRIELDGPAKHAEFMWPPDANMPFAGSHATIRDLNGDGIKEIVVYDGGQDVRVVFYEDGTLHFRHNHDFISSRGYGVGPFELDSQVLFRCGVLFTSRGLPGSVPVPGILEWTRATGFIDVTQQNEVYYRASLLPEMKASMAEETDTERKTLFRLAIDKITQELKEHRLKISRLAVEAGCAP